MELLPFSELFGRVTGVAAVVAGALGAAGASWKFMAWLRDRRLNARVESAAVLSDRPWARLRAAGGFLQTNSCSAYVEPLDRRAWAGIALAYAAGSALAVAACALLAFAVFDGLGGT
jgi:hypothetical protein